MAEGRVVDVAGRGPMYVRGAQGPRRAPTVVLLHGLGATAALNWDAVIPALASRFHVIAPDLRGHGRGPRCGGRFRLEDCADDVAALIEATTNKPVLVVGYSMGGAVAQLLAHRRPDLVSGLVLCATARDFRGRPAERLQFTLLGTLTAASHLTPDWWPSLLPSAVRGFLPTLVRELGGHQSRAILAAAASLGTFTSRAWVAELTPPAVVVVTQHDKLVPVHRQRKLAASLDAPIVELPGHHLIPHRNPLALATAISAAIALLPRRPRIRRRKAA
ncbi:MAG TPA: alpha/beta hydrolase [Acidimicrobiales bacterium]|nr:alpha/beta hydrolase [Acidimicrobiales bacterium]